MQTADVVIFVVDATVGATDVDEAAVRMLRRSHKPVILVANKADNQNIEIEAVVAVVASGLGEPFPISALHGRGSGDLLDDILAALPPAPPIIEDGPRGPRRVALVGRPNVGKSQPAEQAGPRGTRGRRLGRRHHRRPGRQPGARWTARSGSSSTPPACASGSTRHPARSTTRRLRTAGAVEAAEVGVVLLDAAEPISEQDQRVLSQVVEAGRALVIAFNKWDLVDDDRRHLPGQGDRPRAASASRGRSGSTSPPRPAEPSTSSRRRCARRWTAGSSGSRPARSTSG